MRILMINVVCGIRSTGRICTDLAAALEAQGHEVKIAYGREGVPEQYKKYAVRIGNDWDVNLHGVKARLFDACGFGSIRATREFINWVKEYDPDVIHLHNIHGYYINIDILFDYLKSCGKRILWTLHDCWAFTGHCAHFSAANCSKWESGCLQCIQKKSYPKSYTDFSNRNWEHKKALFSSLPHMTIITPSNWLMKEVKRSFLKQYECICIPNGVDLCVFRRYESDFKKSHAIDRKKIVLGCATAWSEKKGLSFFNELSKVLDEDYVIVLVGVSEKQRNSISSKIICIERTNSPEKLAEIYSSAFVFINASQEETMGLTTVEAMACGTPVIVTNKTAVPEVVKPCGGYVLDDFSPNRVISIMNQINSVDLTPRVNALDYELNAQYQKYIHLYMK